MNSAICGTDNGRVLGYYNSHGHHHGPAETAVVDREADLVWIDPDGPAEGCTVNPAI